MKAAESSSYIETRLFHSGLSLFSEPDIFNLHQSTISSLRRFDGLPRGLVLQLTTLFARQILLIPRICLFVSLITVMFYLDYLISLTHLCVSLFFVTTYRIDRCIELFSCTAAKVFNKFTYLLTYLCPNSSACSFLLMLSTVMGPLRDTTCDL